MQAPPKPGGLAAPHVWFCFQDLLVWPCWAGNLRRSALFRNRFWPSGTRCRVASALGMSTIFLSGRSWSGICRWAGRGLAFAFALQLPDFRNAVSSQGLFPMKWWHALGRGLLGAGRASTKHADIFLTSTSVVLPYEF